MSKSFYLIISCIEIISAYFLYFLNVADVFFCIGKRQNNTELTISAQLPALSGWGWCYQLTVYGEVATREIFQTYMVLEGNKNFT
jgi:hypothetical protein